eukprot:CAMPEP_0117420852 /NCGR_PEP_ID=MMETSP0758-20121206/2104_1 /TAXON_ID=63605 /ORGANISM="Percolomonas cosmopolitus, Strain AE-1 (ATCC 50343)" /LENGTH=408 /DNA_ID=CAMNT_0005202711 /DNA_START=564 /DNA_END=1790 /DNA_ORIENTATION=+
MKAIDGDEKCPVVLKRLHQDTNVLPYHNLHNSTLHDDIIFAWSTLRHENLVSFKGLINADYLHRYDESSVIKEVKTTDPTLIYEFYHGAETLHALYLVKIKGKSILSLKEPRLFSYLCQSLAALRAIHQSGLAYGMFHLKNMITTANMNRILLNYGGAEDFCGLRLQKKMENLQADLEYRQRRDFVDLACTMIDLSLKKIVFNRFENPSINLDEVVNAYDKVIGNLNFSKEWKHILRDLLHATTSSTCAQYMSKLTIHYVAEMESLTQYGRYLEVQLSKSLHNDRLFRLLAKLCFVYGAMVSSLEEMRVGNTASRWSETGDLYVLRLFFHQLFGFDENLDTLNAVNYALSNRVNYGELISLLNKLDCGVTERIALRDRHKQHILIVSFEELKEVFLSLFEEPPTFQNK